MKTIKEAAEEHSIGKENESESIDGFIAGVEFAQRWIPVSEEMPKYGVKVLVMIDDISGKVHPNGFIDIDWAVNIAHGKKAFDCEISSSDIVTHWRPIELK